MLVVAALGGNAVLRPGQAGSFAEQRRNVATAARQLARLAARGADLVIVHGNGPQVGEALLRVELAADRVPPLPLASLVAQTQAHLGTLIQLALQREFRRHRIDRPVAALVTHVLVDPSDPAFERPTKPIGRFFPDLATARRSTRDPRARWQEFPGLGWRRVVPSPAPHAVLELPVIRRLVAAGVCVIAAGGGGVPVAGDDLEPVAAVVDKDAAACLLAVGLRADRLLILTAVPGVALDYGRPGQRFLRRVRVDELRRHLDDGRFEEGSMAPKVRAACRFVSERGCPSAIAALGHAEAAFEERAGTLVLPR